MLGPMEEQAGPVEEPCFRVIRGTPSVEELAALVGVLVRRSRPGAPAPPPPRSRWRASGLPATPPRPGPGAWRAATQPR
jgi:Acyl-CoA carboxylase epsilon subunit